MRTVTFSQPEVQNVIANHFVAFHSNIQGDPAAGDSIGHPPSEPAGPCDRGNGRQNVQLIFMNADLELIHVCTGYMSPSDLLLEMQFAAKLFENLKKETANRFDLIRTSHEKAPRTSELTEQRQRLESQFSSLQAAGESRLDGRMTGGSIGRTSGGGQRPSSGIARDYQYMVKHPLISMASFQRDPAALVGSRRSFFSATTNASRSATRR